MHNVEWSLLHPPPNLFVLHSESSLPINNGFPFPPAPSNTIPFLYILGSTTRSPFAFVNDLFQYNILKCIQVVPGFPSLLGLYSMGRLHLLICQWVLESFLCFVLFSETAMLFSMAGTPPLSGSTTLCRSPVSPTLLTFFFLGLPACLQCSMSL